jgi:HAD superfamily hydrolase (TIGR01509 family)
MAIASGGGRSIVEATLDILGLRHLFAAIVTVEDVQRGKPAPDLFLQAAQMLAVSPADCIVYEDSEVGLTAAKLAGMRAVDVRSVTKIASH